MQVGPIIDFPFFSFLNIKQLQQQKAPLWLHSFFSRTARAVLLTGPPFFTPQTPKRRVAGNKRAPLPTSGAMYMKSLNAGLLWTELSHYPTPPKSDTLESDTLKTSRPVPRSVTYLEEGLCRGNQGIMRSLAWALV